MISPAPPVADLTLPWDAADAAPTIDPIEQFTAARARHGDTFGLRSGDRDYLVTFSPTGMQSFYGLEESEASKGVADWRMLRRKVGDDLFRGRRTLPHDMFGRSDAERYRHVLAHAIRTELDLLGNDGEFEIFGWTRRLGHRLGLASWGAPTFVDHADFDALVTHLDLLDPSDVFVRPDISPQRNAVDQALEAAVELIGSMSADSGNAYDHGWGDIVARWADQPDGVARRGAALDLILVHLGSMSNLFAATGWMIVDLLSHPAICHQALGDTALLEGCALESTRLAQRSIMLREVVAEYVLFDTGDQVYEVGRGTTIATLLPVLNTSAAPGLDRYDPSRWSRRRLISAPGSSAPEPRELVTAFGHGRHSCPAQPFSLHAMCASAAALLESFELTPRFDTVEPQRVQIGGVARSQTPCMVTYHRR